MKTPKDVAVRHEGTKMTKHRPFCGRPHLLKKYRLSRNFAYLSQGKEKSEEVNLGSLPELLRSGNGKGKQNIAKGYRKKEILRKGKTKGGEPKNKT